MQRVDGVMGISFSQDMRIAGYRPAVFKSALRGFARTKSPGNLIDLKSVFPLRRDGAIVFEECLERGLIERKVSGRGYALSDKGLIVARGKTKPRTPLAQAQEVLDGFLRRVDALNCDPDAVRYIDQVWLFGSVLRGQDTVGDIDLALVTARRPEYLGEGFERMLRHIEHVAPRYGNVPACCQLWELDEWVTGRALYGARRHPLLSGVQNRIDDLTALGVPCRLVYDRTRGGRVGDPVLERHPLSKGRNPALEPPARMPDLTPTALQPMNGRWVAGFCDSGRVYPSRIFRGWTDDAHKLFPTFPEGLRIAVNGQTLSSKAWTPEVLTNRELDGRERIAFVNAAENWGASIVLRRQINRAPSGWTMQAWFEEPEVSRKRQRIDALSLLNMAAAAALIIAVDAERMLRRAAEETSGTRVEINLSVASDEDISAFLVQSVHEDLQTRVIQVEPEAWPGEPVSIVCAC